MTLRKMTLCTFKDNNTEYPPNIKRLSPFIFLGEITNMEGHGIFLSHQTGKIVSGLHIDAFRECTENEI